MVTTLENVLIVDDDEDDVFLLQNALEEIGSFAKPTVFSNGSVLISALETVSKPTIIFLDLFLPLRSGQDCLKEIRKRKRFNEVIIVILTGFSSKDLIDDCLENGANYFFIKPTTYDGLKDIVTIVCMEIFSAQTKGLNLNKLTN